MKTIIFTITTLFLGNLAFSQSMKVAQIDTVLSKEQFQSIINKEFNSVINGSGKTTIGNYASVDIKDGRLAFNATKKFTNGNMLSVNANGSITDGFFSIFNRSKVNSNVGIDLKYNVRFKSSSVSYHTAEMEKLSEKKNKANLKYQAGKHIFAHDTVLLNKRLNLLNTEIDSIATELANINLSLSKIQRATYEYQIALKNVQKDSLWLKMQTIPTAKEADRIARSKKDEEITAEIESFEYTNIFFHWVSFGVGMQNHNFNQFNPDFPTLDEQIKKQNFVGWNASVEYNVFNWNQYARPTHYFLIGLGGSIGDNFADLSKIELSDTKIYGDAANQRTVTKKFNAYQGDYNTKLLGAEFYMDYYRFFFKNSAAFHLYPEVGFKQQRKPLYNAGAGLLYSFKGSKDNKSRLHAELYFALSDLSNIGDSDLSIWRRNELGLRLSTPISFLNF